MTLFLTKTVKNLKMKYYDLVHLAYQHYWKFMGVQILALGRGEIVKH